MAEGKTIDDLKISHDTEIGILEDIKDKAKDIKQLL